METSMEEGDCLSQENETTWNDELDMSQLCRICANPNEYLIPIFYGEGQEHELETKIAKHLPIKVKESDELPTNLCYQCASTLIAWHDMVEGFVEADEKLKTMSSYKTGKYTKTTSKIINKENQTESCIDPQDQNIPLKKINAMPHISQGQDTKPLSVETEEIAIEKETTSVKPGMMEEESTDSRELIMVEKEEPKDEVIEEADIMETIIGSNEDGVISEVEVYEHPDVETSIVMNDIVEGLEEGQYIAYIGDDFIQSVEVANPDLEEDMTEGLEETTGYICEECNKIFMDIESFQNHLSLHESKFHFCTYCDATYRRVDHLQKHIEILHPEANTSLQLKQKKVNPYAKTFLCNTCGKILKSSIAYENHTLKHQSKCPYPCDLCSETFPNRGARRKHEVREHNLLTKENGNPDGYHVCEICGLEMFSDGAYYHHKDKHGDPYPCTFCGKLYGSRSLMQVHARRHTTERPFMCSICNRNFKVKQELNAHMNIHRDLRPYQCPHCPKMCRKSSDLTHHIRTHTGEKPYICDKCGRGFAQAGDMRKHRQLHFRPSKINKNPPSA